MVWVGRGDKISGARNSGYAMDATELLAAINLLAQRLEHTPEDLHEIHFKVREMIDELKATGMPPPDDLLEFERDLANRIDEAESQGGTD